MNKYVVNDGVKIVIKNITFNAGEQISSDVFDSFSDFEKLIKLGKIKKSNTANPKAEIEKSISEVTHAVGVNLKGETEIDMTPKEQLENSENPEKELKKRGKRKAK